MINVKYTHKESNIKTESDFKDKDGLEQHKVDHPEMYDESTYNIVISDTSEQDKKAEVNQKSLEYLASTDWMVTRKSETGKEIPKDVLEQRQAARDQIQK